MDDKKVVTKIPTDYMTEWAEDLLARIEELLGKYAEFDRLFPPPTDAVGL